ncbi:MAG: Na+/H+ antiporter NhaA [Rickettsiales bacterium]
MMKKVRHKVTASVKKRVVEPVKQGVVSPIREFLKLEASGGIILMATAMMAMALANSIFAQQYEAWLKPLHYPINDGLMVIFFLLIGLEIKREIVEGELSTLKKAALPLVGALGGVVLPAAIYAYFNWGTDEMRGWAIPCATDIAFSLGIVALFGSKLNSSLKIFLMALAVIDDLVAVLIIAIFYTSNLSFPALGVATGCMLVLWAMNRSNVAKLLPYMLVGIVLWAAVLQSGVHATIAGVLLGLIIPVALGKKAIHTLHPWVAFGIMPLFAFANAGVPLDGITTDHLMSPMPLGIIAGLFVGKQLGIFAFSWVAVKTKMADMPIGVNWLQFYAIGMIAGIGFTMSLFIGGLAFTDPLLQIETRLGVIVGSLLSAMFGAFLLWLALRPSLNKV